MLIIDSKDCENIDKALKKYKKKFEKSKTLINLRARQAYVKPSVKRRTEVLKALRPIFGERLNLVEKNELETA